MSRNLELIANLFVRLPKICEKFYWHAAFCSLQIYSCIMTCSMRTDDMWLMWTFQIGWKSHLEIWIFTILSFALELNFSSKYFLRLSILIANWNSHQFHKDNVELNNVVRTQLKCGDYMKLLSQKISCEWEKREFWSIILDPFAMSFPFFCSDIARGQVSQCINKRPTEFASSFSISRS